MEIRITKSGHLFVMNGDNYDELLDYIIETSYNEEFCISDDFSPDFIAALMNAGFLVMSAGFGEKTKPFYMLFPKHHLIRSILFFDKLHIGKTAARLLSRYELRAGADFERIVTRCVEKHGDTWLTKPLIESIAAIQKNPGSPVKPLSFGLYQDGILKAGEFGIVSGRVYTSYSGYYDENSAGRVQMIKTALFLHDTGFAFWDLGMPLDYKYTFGAEDVDIKEFTHLFRSAQENLL